MVTIANILTFTTGGVLGYLLRALIDHKLARSRSIEILKITEYNKAAADFRTACNNVFSHLRQNFKTDDSRTKQFIPEDIIIAHGATKLQFESFLDKTTLARFNSIWADYEKCKNDYDDSTDADYFRYYAFCMIDHIYDLLDIAQSKY